MATVIRMQRGGRTHAPYYRVVVVDSRTRNRGRVLDELGIYHPCAQPTPRVELDREKTLQWLSQGVRLSETARSVLSSQGILAEFAKSEAGQQSKADQA